MYSKKEADFRSLFFIYQKTLSTELGICCFALRLLGSVGAIFSSQKVCHSIRATNVFHVSNVISILQSSIVFCLSIFSPISVFYIFWYLFLFILLSQFVSCHLCLSVFYMLLYTAVLWLVKKKIYFLILYNFYIFFKYKFLGPNHNFLGNHPYQKSLVANKWPSLSSIGMWRREGL